MIDTARKADRQEHAEATGITSAAINRHSGGPRKSSELATVYAIFLRCALAILTAVLAAAGAASPASAYAAGNSTWGTVCALGKCFPSGTMLHVIDSTGVWVRYDRAEITSAAPICNWWIDFDYYDNSNVRYKHIQGQAHNYCTRDGSVRVDYPAIGPQDWRTGRACATAYTSSIFLTRQCHYLHP